MNKAKLTKIAIKAVVGGVTAVLIGATIKQERRFNELIDAKYEETPVIPTEL